MNKANWLRGYLESLSYGDSISKQQLQVLMTKMNELVSEIEEYEQNKAEEEIDEIASTAAVTQNTVVDDDLPF